MAERINVSDQAATGDPRGRHAAAREWRRRLAVVSDQFVGSDFVRRVSVRCDSIRSEHDRIDFVLVHEQSGGVVGDEVDGNALAHQLPGGEAGALQSRPRLVHPHVDLLALVVSRVDHADRSAVVNGGESTDNNNTETVDEDTRRREIS